MAEFTILPNSVSPKFSIIDQNCLKNVQKLSNCPKISQIESLSIFFFFQNKISEVGQSIVMHVEELKRLLRKLDVIEQIHMAPSIYLATAVEVVRRRAFTEQYMKKAVSIAETFSTLNDEELTLRTNFHVKLRKHFLSKMFPGMEDMPPSFASARPKDFDKNLPVITLKDVEVSCHFLKKHFIATYILREFSFDKFSTNSVVKREFLCHLEFLP